MEEIIFKQCKQSKVVCPNGATIFQMSYNKQIVCELYNLSLCKGTDLLIIDNSLKYLPSKLERKRDVSLNFCLSGRCELELQNNRFIYIEPNCISVDTHLAKSDFCFPTERYIGIEYIVDIGSAKSTLESILLPFDVSVETIIQRFCKNGSSYIAQSSKELSELIKKIYKNKSASRANHLLWFIQSLLGLESLPNDSQLNTMKLLTKGQVDIARDAEAFLSNNLDKHIYVTTLAKQYSVSPSAFKNYFKGVFGVPISQYVRELRMKKAKTLLEESELQILSIANKVGYENQSKFAATFKQNTGASPLEYRRIMRAKKGMTK